MIFPGIDRTKAAGWLWVVPLLLAVIAYAPAPWGEAIYDDIVMLERQLPNFQSIPDALVLTRDKIVAMPGIYYRPVVVISYMLDRSLYSGWFEIGGFHISNVLFHVLTTFFVWLLARRMLCDSQNIDIGAFAAAAMFAVHPIHVETVSWISGRSDLLATLFAIPSVMAALRWRDFGSGAALALGALFYLLALMSKEVGLATLVLVPVTFWLAPAATNESDGAAIKPSAHGAFVWVTTGIAYVGTTAIYWMLKPAAGYGLAVELSSDMLPRLVQATGYYLIKVVLPWPQSGFVTWDQIPGLAACALALIFALGVTLTGLRRWINGRGGLLLYVMLWFGATLAPSLIIAVSPALRNPVAERYLYFPSVAMALLFGMIVATALAGRRWRPSALAFVLVIVVFGIATVQRGLVWQNGFSYWSDAAKASRDHPLPLNELGSIHYSQGDLEEALNFYQRALETIESQGFIETQFSNLPSLVYNNIGMVYRDQRNLGEAERFLDKARDLDPDFANPYYSLGIVYGMRAGAMASSSSVSRDTRDAMLDKSIEAYHSVLQLDPGFPMTRWMLSGTLKGWGELLEKDGDTERAAEKYQLSLDQVDQMIIEDPALRYEANVQAQRDQVQSNLDRLTRPN